MKRIAFLLFVLAVLAIFTTRPVLAEDDVLIVAGAGFVGQWNTEFEIANVATEPIDVELSIGGLPLGVPCPPNCTTQTYALPGAGTIRVQASDFIGATYPGPQLVRIQAQNAAPLPVVHARSVSSGNACQFAELPVVRQSSIRNTPVLVFPGVARGGGFYTNLILQSLSVAPTSVEVELRGAAGDLLGTAAFPIPGLQAFASFTLVDVAKHFGVETIQDGQVRVRNLTATGPVWGVLATVGTEGSLRISTGANP